MDEYPFSETENPMPQATKPTAPVSPTPPRSDVLLQVIHRHFEACREVRRGVCLLNAGQYERAAEAFQRAKQAGCKDRSLASYLAACFIGQERPDVAAEHLSDEAASAPERPELVVRQSLALWAAGRREEAIDSLRDGIRVNPECAELHFQLGTLLAAAERFDEAELRFTQTLNLDPDHTDALVNVGLCCAVRGASDEALRNLQRAQVRRPHDARIGLLLTQAAKAVAQLGHVAGVRASMPDEELEADRAGIEELSQIIESAPDFVDAFLSIPAGKVDERVFALLLDTLLTALQRQPQHAELHFQCGRVLDRLGRQDEAIDAGERAVQINPRYTRALIALGKLYQKTDRAVDATTRLEQAIAAGAEYADVYYLLGNLYRDRGEVVRARSAYRRALSINAGYAAAREALATLRV